MFFFEGATCGVCGRVFDKDDDVVACPECGSPHHRQCYKDNGGCAFEEKHSEGYSWKRESNSQSAEENTDKAVICGICGAENANGRLYCCNCSSPLFDKTNGGAFDNNDTSFNSRSGSSSARGEVISDGELIEGVPVGDYKRFLGNSSFIYLPIFLALQRKLKRFVFSIFALFLHGIWFISRKMYLIGISILGVQLSLYLFECRFNGYLQSLYELSAKGDYTAFVQSSLDRPFLFWSLILSALLRFAVCVLCGFFGNRIYMKWCSNRIKKINQSSKSADEFNKSLEASSGSNMLLSFISITVYYAAQFYLGGLLL